jgi:hypothetical protein
MFGSFLTWKVLDEKYRLFAQEEIDSVKEAFGYKSRNKTSEPDETVNPKIEKKKDISEYAKLINGNGYTEYSKGYIKTKLEEKPCVISPEEFGENEEYDSISLVYYADKVLADNDDRIIEDVEETVGFDSLSTFGNYEDDSVFIRNDARKCYYEILADSRKYSEVAEKKPREVG